MFLSSDNGTAAAAEVHGMDWGSRFMIYCVMGIVIMVALSNIFIGLMSNTYDHFQERATRLFVRQRAWVALENALLRWYFFGISAADQEGCLWICTSSVATEDSDSRDLSL